MNGVLKERALPIETPPEADEYHNTGADEVAVSVTLPEPQRLLSFVTGSAGGAESLMGRQGSIASGAGIGTCLLPDDPW